MQANRFRENAAGVRVFRFLLRPRLLGHSLGVLKNSGANGYRVVAHLRDLFDEASDSVEEWREVWTFTEAF